MNMIPLLAALGMTLSLLSINLVNENITSTETTFLPEQQSSQFLAEVEAFDEYYSANPSAMGDVTDSVILPGWLPKNDNVKMIISAGIGYVFMPVSSGTFNLVLKKTKASSFVGMADSSHINTPSGAIPKPTFIPDGNIVYVR
jgi:hypothetical protein